MVLIQFLLLFVTCSWAVPTAHNIGELLQIEDPHVFYGDLGFKISTKGTKWETLKNHESTSTIQAQFYNPQGSSQAKLTVRSERLKGDLKLERYVRRSKQDFKRFGFDILAQRPLKVSGHYAYLIDLKMNQSPMQVRQVLFKKENKVVILTCSAHQDDFKTELKACNTIYRNFNWLN